MISVLGFSRGANFASEFFIVSYVCVESIGGCCETVCSWVYFSDGVSMSLVVRLSQIFLTFVIDVLVVTVCVR